MLSRSKKKKASPLGQVLATIEKKAASPIGLSFLGKFGPRLIPILTPILVSALGFFGFFPGCSKTPSGSLPEITQKIRPGGKNEVIANDPNRPNPFQLTATTKNQTPTSQPTSPQPTAPKPTAPISPTAGAGYDIVFAFWNCENFFDDQNDNRTGPADKDYDPWYAKNPDILRLKLEKMTEAILSINSGRGPDILALCEVENIRAMQLLQNALNAKIADPRLRYPYLVMKEMNNGRHIAPAVLSRLPVNNSRTKVIGSRQRTVQCHLMMGEKELIVIATHWTSRLQDGERQRIDYADKIYGACTAIYLSNPKADFIICGDLNDNPTDTSIIKGLHSSANPAEAAASAGGLRLFNLFGTWTPAVGTGSIFYQGWHQFDQILVSPGMLDAEGWSCDPSSVRVVNHLTKPADKNRRPWRFGGEKDTGPRGYSDHFPVTVRLIARP